MSKKLKIVIPVLTLLILVFLGKPIIQGFTEGYNNARKISLNDLSIDMIVKNTALSLKEKGLLSDIKVSKQSWGVQYFISIGSKYTSPKLGDGSFAKDREGNIIKVYATRIYAESKNNQNSLQFTFMKNDQSGDAEEALSSLLKGITIIKHDWKSEVQVIKSNMPDYDSSTELKRKELLNTKIAEIFISPTYQNFEDSISINF